MRLRDDIALALLDEVGHMALEMALGPQDWFSLIGKMGVSENVGLIFPMIASHLKTG